MEPIKYIYRVVHIKRDGYFIYKLQEKNNCYYFTCNGSSEVFGFTEHELKKKVDLYQEALKYPIIRFEDIKSL